VGGKGWASPWVGPFAIGCFLFSLIVLFWEVLILCLDNMSIPFVLVDNFRFIISESSFVWLILPGYEFVVN